MLSLAPATGLNAPSDTLVGLLAMLHPNARMGSPGVLLEAARHSAGNVLRELRHHLYENSLLFWALREAEPAGVASYRGIVAAHGELRRLSHELCRRLRREDLRGTRTITRILLALFLEHASRERILANHLLRSLDLAATGRFAEALLERMLSDLALGQEWTSKHQSVVDLHSHYIRLIRHVQGRPIDSHSTEVSYEDPCRR
ncbi:MAG TPA: hypothetical protein VG457_19405 [Planctomycetota bacterium]|nr:hypothetical protein [Planctomycetota bacterium]